MSILDLHHRSRSRLCKLSHQETLLAGFKGRTGQPWPRLAKLFPARSAAGSSYITQNSSTWLRLRESSRHCRCCQLLLRLQVKTSSSRSLRYTPARLLVAGCLLSPRLARRHGRGRGQRHAGDVHHRYRRRLHRRGSAAIQPTCLGRRRWLGRFDHHFVAGTHTRALLEWRETWLMRKQILIIVLAVVASQRECFRAGPEKRRELTRRRGPPWPGEARLGKPTRRDGHTIQSNAP